MWDVPSTGTVSASATQKRRRNRPTEWLPWDFITYFPWASLLRWREAYGPATLEPRRRGCAARGNSRFGARRGDPHGWERGDHRLERPGGHDVRLVGRRGHRALSRGNHHPGPDAGRPPPGAGAGP